MPKDTEYLYDRIKDADAEIVQIAQDGKRLRERIGRLIKKFGEGLDCDVPGALDHVEDMVADLVSDATDDARRRKGEADDAISNAEFADLMLSRVL